MSGDGKSIGAAEINCAAMETPLSPADADYIRSRCLDDQLDQCVEGLIDWIRERACNFRFQKPLDRRFEIAQDFALTCLEIADPAQRRRYEIWLLNCLLCYDVLTLHFLQSVLKEEPDTFDEERPTERSVYQAIARLRGRDDDKALRDLAKILNALYDKRCKEAAHIQVQRAGKRDFKRKGAKEYRKMFKEARSLFAKAGGILIEQYRTAFPDDQH